MSTYEVFIEKPIENDDLADAVSTSLQVELEQVEVVDDIESSKGSGLVTIVRKLICGEFATYLTVYAEPEASNVPESQFALYLSESFSCRVLFSDDSPNPYLYKCVSSDGAIKEVLLKDEPLDKRGEVILVKSFNQ